MDELKEEYMREAIKEAEKAAAIGEVPIGAVIVWKGEIIGRGHNEREVTNDATTHAEMTAIRQANAFKQNWRLEEAELYVTLEPCPMCCGAILLSRIKKVYYGASDLKGGTAGTLMNLLQDERFNHQSEVERGGTGGRMPDAAAGFFPGAAQRTQGKQPQASLANICRKKIKASFFFLAMV